MFKFLKWATIRQLVCLFTTIAIVTVCTLGIPFLQVVIGGAALTNFSPLKALFGSVAMSIGFVLLVLGCLTMTYLRFFMQIGSSRDKALIVTILSNMIMVLVAVALFYIIRLIDKDAVYIPIKYLAFGYVLAYFLGFAANAVVSCLRPRYSVPVLILYFGLILNSLSYLRYEFIFNNLWLLGFVLLAINVVGGYLIFKSKFSVIKSCVL